MNPSDPENPVPAANPPAWPSGDAPAPVPPPGDYPPPELSSVPEDIRTPWGLRELILFALFFFATLVVLEVVLQLYLVMRYHMNIEQLKHLLTTNAPLAVSFQAVWSAIVLLFLFLMIRFHHQIRFWTGIGWRKLRSQAISPAGMALLCIFGGVFLALSVGAISHFIGVKSHVPFEAYFKSRQNVLWLMAYGILFAPVFEETVFRGYLYPVFARKFGIWGGIVITGFLFGLMHAAQLWGGWVQIGLLIFVGIVLTYVRARTGTVVASYLVHVSYNSFLFLAFFIGTSALRHFPPLH